MRIIRLRQTHYVDVLIADHNDSPKPVDLEAAVRVATHHKLIHEGYEFLLDEVVERPTFRIVSCTEV